MSAGVLDASIAVSWCFEDEASRKTDGLLDRVRDEGAQVPALWHLEVANVLLQAERRGRLAAGDVALRLELMAALPIATDNEAASRAWREILALARPGKLTIYDAAYLELAIRAGLPLFTKDEALAAAARKVGVEVFP